jgi:hypothetical protein
MAYAAVAELADAQDLKSHMRNLKGYASMPVNIGFLII